MTTKIKAPTPRRGRPPKNGKKAMSAAERSALRRDRQAASAAQVSQSRYWAEKALESVNQLKDALDAAALPLGSEVGKIFSSLRDEVRQVSGLLSKRNHEGTAWWIKHVRESRKKTRVKKMPNG